MDLPCKRYSDHKRKGEEPFGMSTKRFPKMQEDLLSNGIIGSIGNGLPYQDTLLLVLLKVEIMSRWSIAT